MKARWQFKKIGDICQIIGGGTPSKDNKEFYKGEFRWATIRDMKSDILSETEFKITEQAIKSSSTNVIPKGNVVIATRVGLGKVCLLKNDTAINQDLRGVIPKNKDKILEKYLFLWFKSIANHIEAAGTGATVHGVKLPFIKSLEIPVPSLSEQRRIVAILDEAFAGIAAAKEKAEQNLKNAKEVFSFTQRKIFNNLKGNDHQELGKLAEFRNGVNFNKSSNGETIKIIGVKDFKNNFFIPYENLDSVVVNGKLNEIDVLRNNDILTVRSNGNQELIGRCMVADSVNERITHSGFTIRIRTNSEKIYPIYLCAYLRSDTIKKQLIGEGTGISIKSLNQKSLSSLAVPIPHISEQRRIVSALDDLSAETSRLESSYQQKLSDLEELKKSVLQQAFSGAL